MKKVKKGVCGVGGVVKEFFSAGYTLWEEGNDVAGFEEHATFATYWTDKGSYLQTVKLNYPRLYSTNTFDVSKYSKLCLDMIITEYEERPSATSPNDRIKLAIGMQTSGGSTVSGSYKYPTYVTAVNNRIEFKADISSWEETNVCFSIQVNCTSPDDTSESDKVQCQIYRIWFEE